MCLNNVKKVRVKKPITVYKVEILVHEGDEDEKWVTFIRDEILERNVILHAKGKLKIYKDLDINYNKCKTISEGAFHSFVNKEDIYPFIKNFHSWLFYKKARIIECIIPCECKCYIGDYLGTDSYASNKIIITNNVTPLIR